MSDFLNELEATQNKNKFDYTPRTGLTPKMQSILDDVEKERDELLYNREKYQVDIPQEQFEVIKNAIANSDISDDESYRWASAIFLSDKTGIPVMEAYNNMESYNKELFGVDNYVPKTGLKAIVDCWQLGTNTLKLGFLGNKLSYLQSNFGSPEEIQKVMDEINAIEQDNLTKIDNQDRNWAIESIKYGAQSAPFTGYVAGAALIGSLFGGGIGAGLSFAASMQQAQGLEYIELLKKGASPEVSLFFSSICGGLEALVETSMGNIGGILGKNAIGAEAKKTLIEKVTGNVFKRLHYNGTFGSLAVKATTEYLKENFEEGIEEVKQDLIEKVTEAIVIELEDLDVEPITAKEVISDAMENFKGGVLGSLTLGVFSTAYNTRAEIKEYSKLKKEAETIPSKKAFVEAGKDSPVLEGMSDPQKTEILEKIHDNKKAKRDELIQKTQEDLAEVYEADEEVNITTDENGNEIEEEQEILPEYRTEEGTLASEYTEPHENNDGTFSSQVDFFDPDGKSPDYGHIAFTVDEENGTLTIDEFKTKKTRNYLRMDMFTELAGKYSGYNIVWNTKGEIAAGIKADLEALNPRGKTSGLNYFELEGQSEAYKQDHRAKQEVLKQLEKSTKLRARERAGIVAIMDAIAKHQKKTFSEWYDTTFMKEGMFGDLAELEEAAKKQTDENGKPRSATGGMKFKQTVDGARAVIYAAENADFSTMAHELSHVWQKQLFGEDAAEAARIFGAQEVTDENGNVTYNWNDRTIRTNKLDENGNPVYISPAENFAYSFEKWLKDGKAPSKEQENVFRKFKEFMKHVIDTLRNFIDMKPEITEFFDKNLRVTDEMMDQAENEQALRWMEQGAQQSFKTEEETVNAPSVEDFEKAFDESLANDQPLTEEEIDELIKEEETSVTEEALKETKLDNVTQAAVASILEDPDIPQEKKVEAVMKANGESYRIKQENIERYKARTDLTEDEKKVAIDDILNNRTTDGNGGGQAYSTLESGKDMLFQIIGKKGARALDEANEETIRMDNQRIAEDMEKAGKDKKVIRMATGWERGADGEWKYEISDIKIKPNPIYQTDEGDYKLAKLSDVIDADEIFKAYPQLKDTILQIQNLPLGHEGNYTEQDEFFPNGIITISSSNLRKENPEFTRLYEEFKNTDPGWKEYERKEAQYDNNEISASDFLEWEEKVWEKTEGYKYFNELLMGRIVPRMVDGLSGESTIAHEIQHAIQHIEGFATGGSPESLTAKAYNSLIDDLAPIYAEIGSDETLQSKIKAYKKANLELDFSRDDILDQMREVEAIKDNDTKLTELWDKLQDISKKYNFVNNAEIEPLFDFRITDIESSNAKEALWRAKRLISERSKEDYHNLAGEVESRNVQDRLGLTVEERRRQLLEDTEDVTRKDQIVIFDNTHPASSIDLDAQNKITEVLNYVQSGKKEHFVKTIGNVNRNLEILAKQNGEDISGYQHSIDNYFIIHDKKNHGNVNREKERGQIAITDKDILTIPNVIEYPDFVVFGAKNRQKNNVLIFAKNLSDGSILYVEEKRTRSRHLAATSLYKMSSASDANTLLSNPTLYAQNDQGSVKIIDLNSLTVNDTSMKSQEELDKEYEDAVKNGDKEKAIQMLQKKAEKNGYLKADYFGNGSWAAPTAVVDNAEDFSNLDALQEYIDDYGGEVNVYGIINGIQGHDENYYFDPSRAGFHGQAASDTAQVYRKLRYDKAGPDTEVTVYRAVPNDINGEKLMRGDWIALSKNYCEEHGNGRYGEGNFHIIEEKVAIKNIWQGEEDMREFGFDDGKSDVEKNVSNNRKLLEITYDDNGNLIPLSQRFNEQNPSILFQEEMTLAGIHNLSEENLQHVFKMGGLANPSMAVIDTASSDFTNFGDISLVAPKSLIAKTSGNNTGTFGADIYSPRYPSINVEVTDKGNTTIKEIIKDIEDDTFRQTVKERIRQAMEDNRPYNANRAFAVPFLLEKGDKSFYVIPEMDLAEDELELYNKAVAADVYSPIDMTDEMKKDFTELYIGKEIEKHKEKYPDFEQKDIDYLNESLRDEDTGYLNSRLFFNYWDHLRTTVRKAGQIDEYKTLDNAKNLVESEKYRDEFESYKKEKIESIDKKERIFNGYTPSGNRRWLDHTLENVSKFMKQQATRGGENFSYGMGSTRARVAPKWTTLEQIAKNKDRLVSKDEFETVKAELESTYDELTDIISDGNGFDAGEARLNEALESVNPLSYLKREYDIDFSEDEKEMFTSFIEALKKMPTEYFETKFNRPVYMNEFYGAVIPRQTSQEVKDKLMEAGLTIKEYDDPATRMQLIRQMGKAANGEILFQNDLNNGINEEILNEAAQFKSWVEYMEYGQVFGIEGAPEDAAADWYRNTWEIANNVSPTTKEIEEAEELKRIEQSNSRRDPVSLDVDFMYMIKKPGNLEAFLKLVYKTLHVDEEDLASMDPDEAQYVMNIIGRTERTFNHGTWRYNLIRVNNDKPLSDKSRKIMLSLIRQRIRDYRAIYADITGQSEYKVETAETGDEELFRRGRKYNHVKYLYEVENMSPEEKTKLDRRITDDEIRDKFKKDNVKMLDPDVEHYIGMVEAQEKKLAKELADQRREFNEDIERLQGMQERDIIRQYNQYLNLKGEADERNIRLPAGLKNIVKSGENFIRNARLGRKRNYNNLVEDWDAFKNQIEAKVKVQERLRAENRIQELEEKIRSEYDAKRMKTLMSKAESLNALKSDYNQKREEAAALRRLKDMRKALVKRVMRRVNFNSIDYTKAREIIAVQKVFEPNMRGGVNKWIGTENKLAREIWSAWNTDSEARDRMAERLTLKGKYDLIRLLDDVKNEEDFDRLTKKELSQIERAMPRQNWIKELGLDVWKEERDNALQLDIKEVERTVWVTDENGNRKEKVITTTEISPEIEELLINALGQDMAYAIRNKHFEDWTTGEMEELARKINKMYKDGRDLLAARRDAEKIEADRIRQKIRDAINNTGIVINDDDPEDIKKKKQAKIDKILGTRHELPGTAANQKEKEQTLLDRLLHSYHDANIRRVARILDNYSEGTWTNLLYWNENECFNKQERAKDRRNKKIEDVINDKKIDMRLLGKTIQIDGMTFTYDEVLMIWAANMNQEDYIQDQKKNDPYFDENNVLEESAYKAIKYGNLILPAEREAFQKMDIEILEAEQQRKDNLQAAILANDQALIDQYKAIPSDKVDINGNIIMTGTAGLKALADARFAKILASTRDIRDQMLPLIEAIRKDYSEEFDRINKVSIEVFNAPVWREKWYLPLIRKTMLGDTHEQRLKQDLLGHSAGTGKAGTEKGFTKKRIEIGALHQAPVELGLYTTWADSVERNEHFIAYAGYIRELNRVLFSKDALGTMQELEDRYGKAMKDYLEVYVKEIANPNYSEPKKGLDRVMHMLRGNTAPAYLGWKFSSILKQGIESPAPFMQFINPVEYMHGAIQLATKKWTRESIAAKSAFMKSRVFDPMVDLINENVEKSFSKKSYYLKKFQQKGMEGLEWIDWACVAPGWIAIYEKEYAKLQGQEQAMFDKRLSELQEQNETRFGTFHLTEDKLRQQAMDDVMMDIEKAAVDKADDCVRLCQPSNRNVDLSPMFKNNSEAAKAVLQFQTALNVIWQNIRYDIPYAIRNKEYANIVGMILGYVMAGIISGVVTEGLKGKGDDDDPEEIAKKIGYYSTTQFIDSVPIVGGNLDALAKKAITGEGGSMYSSSLWPTFDKYYNGASALVSGDYEKALRNMEQGLFLTIGAPTSGIKEIEAALGAFDKDPGLELYPEAFLGRRK